MDSDLTLIVDELNRNIRSVKCEQLDALVDMIINANRVYTYGCGRSGFAMMSFGMRIMHLGKECHYVHDTCVPPIKADDLLIIASGSGNTDSTFAIAERGRRLGCKVVLVSENKDSRIGRIATMCLEMPWDRTSLQPLGNCYDQTQNVVLDTVIFKAMNKMGINEAIMDKNHTNIE